MYVSLAGDKGRLTDAAARKPKSRSKKTTRGEKRKLDTKGRSPTSEHTPDPKHEHNASLSKPEIAQTPKKPKAPKKKDASKETSVVIKEPVFEEKEVTLAPAGTRGKKNYMCHHPWRRDRK